MAWTGPSGSSTLHPDPDFGLPEPHRQPETSRWRSWSVAQSEEPDRRGPFPQNAATQQR